MILQFHPNVIILFMLLWQFCKRLHKAAAELETFRHPPSLSGFQPTFIVINCCILNIIFQQLSCEFIASAQIFGDERLA